MLDTLQFETEIKGGAIKTLTDIQELLGKISQKTTITIAVDGLQDFQKFVQSEDFKNVAKNISSAFGGAKANNVTQFFTNLRTEIDNMKNSLKSNDFSAFMTQMGQLTQKFNELATAYHTFLSGSGSKGGSDVITDMNRRLKEVEKTISQLEPAFNKLKKKSEQLETQQAKLADKQKKLGEQTKKTTKEIDDQRVSMNGLQNMMGRYLSIYAIGRFASEMAQITGELELQKRSLEVIVGNADKANELYSTIRDMSQMSPYTFQDLMKSTRQLSAFGVETKDLYDTMKALSDIGAGLSVDVQRLILAYGHTRSYGYLSGIQNRQFETAGIDMIGGLVEYYNKLADAEERAGRSAERFTRKDVFKRMSKRDISFEDVSAVIMNLEKEGGRFFNMQERQFETLGGQLRNLRNNYNIMMSEMGEQNKGILRFGVNLLNNLTGNWEKYATVIKGLILPLGALKYAIFAVNQANKEGISLFTKGGLDQVLKGSRKLGENLKNIITSAGTWITLAVSAVISIISHYRTMAKEAQRVTHDLVEATEKDVVEIERILSKYQGGAITITPDKRYINGSEVEFNQIEFNKEAMRTLDLGSELEEMKRKLQAISPFYDGDLVDIYRLQTQEEQFEAIIKRLDSYRLSNDILGAYEDTIAKGAKGGSPFHESLITNLKDYADAIDHVGNVLRHLRSIGKIDDEVINVFKGELDDKITGRNTAEKIESLRNYFVETLYMTEDERQKLYNSWSEGLQEAYSEAMGLLETKGYKQTGLGVQWRDFLSGPDKSAVQSLDELYYNLDRMVEHVKPAFEQMDDLGARLNAAKTLFSRFANDAKLSTADAQPLADYFVEKLGEALGTSDEIAKASFKFMDEFGKAMQEEVKKNKNWTADEAFESAKPIIEQLALQWKQAGKSIAEFYNEGFKEGLQNSARSMVENRMAWQKEVQGARKEENAKGEEVWVYSDFYNDWSGQVRAAGESMEDVGEFFGERMKKEHDDIAKDIENLFKPAAKKWGITIDPELEVKTKNLEQLKNVKQQVEKKLEGGQGPLSPEELEGLTEFNKELGRAISLEEKAKEYGFLYGDDKKTGNGYKAEFEKRWDERIRIMKEAYDWYDKWEKKVGHDKALEKVNARYQDVFEEWRTDNKVPLNFDIKEIADYQKYIEQIRDAALDLYGKQKNDPTKNNGQEALRVYRQAVSLLTDINYDNVTKAAEKFSSIIKKTLDDMDRRWDLYKSVLDATHDQQLAYDIAGMSEGELEVSTEAAAARINLEDLISDAGFSGIELDLSLDEEGIRDMFKNAIPDTDDVDKYATKIDGLVDAYQKWQGLQRDLIKSDVQVFSKLLGSVNTYEKQLHNINEEVREEIASAMRLQAGGFISTDQMNTAIKLAVAGGDYKKMKLSADYINMFNHALGMTKERFDAIAESVEEATKKANAAGLLSPEEYTSEMQRIRQARQSFMETPGNTAGAWWLNGYQGMADYYGSQADAARMRGEEEEAKNLENLSDKAKRTAIAMQNLESVIGKVQNAMNFMSGFFSSIGDKGVARDLSSNGVAGSTLSGVASGASIGGVWGAVIGGAMGVVSGVFQQNHTIAQENISQNNQIIKQLEGVNARLDKLRERQFGYGRTDNNTLDYLRGSLQISQMQNRAVGFFGAGYYSDTEDAMKKAIESGSLYQAQYASLMMERDKIRQNMMFEEDDKNGSEEQIEEYRQQLEEIEDQLAHFTEDIAKDLWSIDVKSWADQIGDGLMNAFENGENAAEAYENAVRSIMQNVTSEMLKVGIIQPMMEKLQRKLFGYTDEEGNKHNGVVSAEELLENPQAAGQTIATEAKQWMDGQGQAMITAAKEFYSAMNAGMGGILTNPNTNTLSASVQGTSEETSDLLAGYVNALRQDVAADRILREQFIAEMWPTFVEETMGAVIQPLNQININVAAIRQSMTGQGELISAIDEIYSILNAITIGTKEVYTA